MIDILPVSLRYSTWNCGSSGVDKAHVSPGWLLFWKGKPVGCGLPVHTLSDSCRHTKASEGTGSMRKSKEHLYSGVTMLYSLAKLDP